MSKRSEELQKEYIEKHGNVGKVVSKSESQRKRRYKLHRKAKPGGMVSARMKVIYLYEDPSEESMTAINELVKEFGYVIQSTIK